MKLNLKKIAGGAGALILGIGGLIAAGKSGFCENLGKKPDDETPENPEAAPAEPAQEDEDVKEEGSEEEETE